MKVPLLAASIETLALPLRLGCKRRGRVHFPPAERERT